MRILARRRETREADEAWLYAQDAYQAFVADVSAEVVSFLVDALAIVTDAQREAMDGTERDVRRLAELALGPAPGNDPPPLPRWLAWELGKLTPAAANSIRGSTTDGRPLALLFAELAPEHSRRLIDILASGVASDRSTDLIAMDLRAASNLTLSRAMTITRSETMRAYREAALAIMSTPESIIREWVWIAQPTACIACLAQHGSVHPVAEIMKSHVNCACWMAPRSPSWAELGFDGIPDRRPRIQTGAERFAGFTKAKQLAILGPGKFAAYRDGRVTLDDLVQRTYSDRWGYGSREATLAEALS